MRSFFEATILMLLLAAACHGFSQQPLGSKAIKREGLYSFSTHLIPSRSNPRTVLFLSTEPEKVETFDESSETTSQPAAAAEAPAASSVSVPEPVAAVEEEDSPPLDIPSPLLLATSIILAIVSAGNF